MPLLKEVLPASWLQVCSQHIQPPILSMEDFLERDSVLLAQQAHCTVEEVDFWKQEMCKSVLHLPLRNTSSAVQSKHRGGSPAALSSLLSQLPSAMPSLQDSLQQHHPLHRTFSSGFQEIDRMFGSGFPAGHVISLFGEGQSGKSQLALMTAISTAMTSSPTAINKRHNRVLFIDTKNDMSAKRIQSLLNLQLLELQLTMSTPADESAHLMNIALERLHIEKCYDIWSLMDLLCRIDEESHRNVEKVYDLIVIDCLHHLIAPHLSDSTLGERPPASMSTISAPNPATSASANTMVVNFHPLIAKLHLLFRKITSTYHSTMLITNVWNRDQLQQLTQRSLTMSTRSVSTSANLPGNPSGHVQMPLILPGTGGHAHYLDVYDIALFVKSSILTKRNNVTSRTLDTQLSQQISEEDQFQETNFNVQVLLRPPYLKAFPERANIRLSSFT